MLVQYCLVFILAYLVGSISFAVLISRLYGVNILHAGSGNPGATNVKRCVGKMAGNLVFLLDFLKGFTVSYLPICLNPLHIISLRLAYTAFIGSILGHCCSIFLKFRGGKGIATTMGGLAALMPGALFVGGLIWAVVFRASRFVSLASLCFALSLPLSAYLFSYPRETLLVSWVLMAFLFLRHRTNIRKLIQGSEARFTGV
ncbi:MAG: glycerol-3-phosphate 1-O-acyltransferase PlsY [Puniceicoccales bacterium]|jgi:glycerol-3-phosphate acyltransferase PlsY|nr:glycerol-3-phosphate 1-O-acyltransferase PlsY [Puniceicoccales bacterium]